MILLIINLNHTTSFERNDNPNSTTVHIYGKPIHTVNGENKRTKKKKTALMSMIKF